MKTILSLVLFLFLTVINAQETTLTTKSLKLDNLISFVADNFPLQSENNNEDDEDYEEEVTQLNYQVTFLLETTTSNFSDEDEIILKQAFKFLSDRLSKEDKLSIVVYSGQNGLLLDNQSPKSLKKILHALSDVKKNIIEEYEDGIEEAYSHANSSFNTKSHNILVMVRNPDAKVQTNETEEIVETLKANGAKTKDNSIVLLTAISLLPELIEVIKK
ncbi:hypothetical protein [Mesoflavibacter zeaxanthinifaciens]|uniref:hypothetical protein n=1 Tax=Mesoflavibacter zeaxanthinifaciens TaxID=393060 RepID=UPI003A8EE417